jgi:hypothetical protein
VLDEAEGTAGTQDAPHLGDHAGGVGDRAEHERGDHGLDTAGRESGPLGDTVAKIEPHSVALGGGPQPAVHGGVGSMATQVDPGRR